MKYEKRIYETNTTPKIVRGISGLLGRWETLFLSQVADRIQGEGLYVDLGTFKGRSAILLAEGIRRNRLNDVHVYTVDTFDRRNLSRRFQGAKRIESIETPSLKAAPKRLIEVQRCIDDKGLGLYVTIVQSPTAEAGSKISVEGRSVRFLFIDADHSYEGCKADWLAWRDYIHQDGEVAFHDSHLEGVMRVHTEEMKDWKKVDRVQSISVWHRR